MTSQIFVINPASLQKAVNAATYERGREVYLQQRVLSYSLEPESSTAWHISGQVQGSGRDVYSTSVDIEITSDGAIASYSANCSCPVERNCKHSVAVALKAAYKSGAVRGVVSSPAPAPHSPAPNAAPGATALSPEQAQAQRLKAPTRTALDRTAPTRTSVDRAALDSSIDERGATKELSDWLDLFGDPGTSTAAAPATSASGYGAPDQVVYMLGFKTLSGHRVLELCFGTARVLRTGKWSKVKLDHYFDGGRSPASDKEVVRLITSMSKNSYGYSYQSHSATLEGATGLLALELAAKSGRLFTQLGDRVLDQPIAWGPDHSLAWTWQEERGRNAHKNDAMLWRMVPSKPASMQLFTNQPAFYLDTASGLCGHAVTPGMGDAQTSALLKSPAVTQAALTQFEGALVNRFGGLALPPNMTAPRVITGITPVLRLHIEHVQADQRAELGPLLARLRFDYAGVSHYTHGVQNPVMVETHAWAEQTPGAGLQQRTTRVLVQRDMAAEHTAQITLRLWNLAGDAQGVFTSGTGTVAQSQWLQWVDDGFAGFKDAGFEVTQDQALASWITHVDGIHINLDDASAPHSSQAQHKPDSDSAQAAWFDLSLGIDINGQRHNILPMLPQLLAQLQAVSYTQPLAEGAADNAPANTAVQLQMPPFVYLEQTGGSYLRLPTEPLRPWLEALIELVGERGIADHADRVRLSRLEALRVGASLGAGAQWQGADSLRLMVQQLRGAVALPEVALPTGVHATLRPYQQQGLNWLQFLRTHQLAGILADDMGLGKTVQTLVHIAVEKAAGRLDRPVLIVAPVSVMGNWQREIARFTPGLSSMVWHGADRHGEADRIAQQDIVIMPYSLLARDQARWAEQPWHLVVLDEAQNIKNAQTNAAQAATALNTRHRLCLSGTPMENHLGELWSLFHFLMPGFLGNQSRFKELFRTPIEKHGNTERLGHLRTRVTPFMLRRAKRDVATELPDKQVSITSVELGDKQANLYETIRFTTEKAVQDALANKGLARSQIQVLDALLKLRQVCCDPRLLPLASAKKIKQSAKLELLMELLPQLLTQGRKVLLFSQFTSMLELIEEELKKHAMAWVKLTGQSQKRDQLIARFTSGEVPLFLISLKAGGVGLNLTQADTVIHYDPWWNPAVENQATDRAHRIGQTSQVMVYKLVAQGTIEERMLQLQERKAQLAESMYSASVARKQPLFTESDLAELLKPLSASTLG